MTTVDFYAHCSAADKSFSLHVVGLSGHAVSALSALLDARDQGLISLRFDGGVCADDVPGETLRRVLAPMAGHRYTGGVSTPWQISNGDDLLKQIDGEAIYQIEAIEV